MHELPRTLKLVTIWGLIGLGVFLAVQWQQARERQGRFSTRGGVIELQRAPDGHFHWPGRVNGIAVDFLVDTGATSTTLPQALADQARLTRLGSLRSDTAGGVVMGEIARADIALDGGVSFTQLRVAVLPRLSSPLLGMDVLGRLRYSQAGGVLRLEPLTARQP
jgi:aspartyl protease family protein